MVIILLFLKIFKYSKKCWFEEFMFLNSYKVYQQSKNNNCLYFICYKIELIIFLMKSELLIYYKILVCIMFHFYH